MTGLPITLEMTSEEEAHFNEMYAKAIKSALSEQVGGDHYKDKGIQPIIYIHANNLGFCEGNVVKYVTRWRDKNGVADLKKAIHYLELLIELEGDK